MAAAANMITYVMAHDGIPVIYYGQEQHLDGGTEPYTNRAALWEYAYDQNAVLYKLVAKLNLFRRHVNRNFNEYLTTQSETIDVATNTIAFAKGGKGQPKVITVLNNKLSDADDFKVDLCDTSKHGYAAGDELFDIMACKSVTVSNSGCIEAWISDGEPVVLMKKSALAGSTLCGIEGESDVVLSSVYVQQTVITATATDGQLTVLHSVTTMPWADAPSSVTATSTAAATGTGSSSNSTSAATSVTGAERAIGGTLCYALFVFAISFLVVLL